MLNNQPQDKVKRNIDSLVEEKTLSHLNTQLVDGSNGVELITDGILFSDSPSTIRPIIKMPQDWETELYLLSLTLT